MTENALVEMPAMPLAAVAPMHDLAISDRAVQRLGEIVKFVRQTFQDGIDQATIPGTKVPSLLQPGAEKLNSAFTVTPRYEVLPSSIINWEKGFFYFDVKCSLYYGEQKVGEGIGSCNSKEAKYRYRWMFANEIKNNEELSHLNIESLPQKKTKSNYTMYRVDNNEPFDLVNTLEKMAAKRAYISATKTTYGLSGMFTQDLEDLETRWYQDPDTAKADRVNPDGEATGRRKPKAQKPVEPKQAPKNEPPPPEDEHPPTEAGHPQAQGVFPNEGAPTKRGAAAAFLPEVWKGLTSMYKISDSGMEYAKQVVTEKFGAFDAIPDSLLPQLQAFCRKDLFTELQRESFIPLRGKE